MTKERLINKIHHINGGLGPSSSILTAALDVQNLGKADTLGFLPAPVLNENLWG